MCWLATHCYLQTGRVASLCESCKTQMQITVKILLFCLATSLFQLNVWSQTLADVLSRNIEARGGEEALKAVKTIRASGYLAAGSYHVEFVQENKRPDKVREENIVQGLTRIDAYDGKTGWRVNPFNGRREAQLLSADDVKGLAEDADIDGPLVDYNQKGHKAELLGHDSVEGTDCYKVRLTLNNGDMRTYYIDTDSNLEIKFESQRVVRGSLEENETYLGDYEKVDGLYYPFSFEIAPKGTSEADRVHYTVEKIEVNVPLSDDRFAMPASPAVKPLAAAKSGAAQ